MERIVLEVDTTTARKWNGSSKKLKSQVVNLLSQFLAQGQVVYGPKDIPVGYARPATGELRQGFANAQSKSSEFDTALKDLRKQAKKNGLTPKILGEIMEWDEETMKNLFGTTVSD